MRMKKTSVISGKELTLKWKIKVPRAGAFGWARVELLGDINLDGFSEILWVASLDALEETSLVEIIDGRTGKKIMEQIYDYPLYYGQANIGDVDGDGENEIVWGFKDYLLVSDTQDLSKYTIISIRPYGDIYFEQFLLYDVNNDGALDALVRVGKQNDGYYHNMAFDIKNNRVLWATLYQEKYVEYYWRDYNVLLMIHANGLLDDVNGDNVLDFITISDALVICATDITTGKITFNISLLDLFPFCDKFNITPPDQIKGSMGFPIRVYMVSGDFDSDSISEIILTYPRRLLPKEEAPPSYYKGIVLCIDNGSITWNVSINDYYNGPWGAAIADFGYDFDYDFAMYLDGQLNRLLVFDPISGNVEFNDSFKWYGEDLATIDFNGDNYIDFFAPPFVFDGHGKIIANLSDLLEDIADEIFFFDADGDKKLEMLARNATHLSCFDIPNAGWRIFWDRLGRIVGFINGGCSNSLWFVDGDGDFLSYYSEGIVGSNPSTWDSDGDGLSDGFEVLHGLNPVSWDGDFDFISDSLDPVPLNPLVPTYGLIIVLVVSYLLYRWRLKFSNKRR